MKYGPGRVIVLVLLVLGGIAAAQGDKQPVRPIVHCVIDFGNNHSIAVFRYENNNSGPVIINAGEENYFEPAIESADPPQIFKRTIRPGTPNVDFEVPFTDTITWYLQGESATASADSEQCVPARPSTIEVMMDQPLQTLEGFGGAYVFRFSKTMDRGRDDLVAAFTFDTLRPTHMRFNIPLDLWEPQNDNDDPFSFNMDAFRLDNRMETTFEYMQKAQERGIVIHASTWNAPDWMVQDPSRTRERILKPDMYDELVESLTAFLMKARDDYGITIDTVSLNEPNLGIFVSYTSQQYADIVVRSGQRFADEGIPTLWALGESNAIGSAAEYAAPIWANEAARQYMPVWAFHSWDAGAPDETMHQNVVMAKEMGLPIWITEVGYDAELYFTPESFETWEHALAVARTYSRLYKSSGVNVPFYWQMLDDYRLASPDDATPYPAYDILLQLRRYVPVGSTILNTSDDRTGLYSFAAQTPDGNLTLYLVNDKPAYQAVLLSSLPDGVYRHLRSSSDETAVELEMIDIAGERINLFLPGMSVSIITTLPEDAAQIE